MIHLINVSFIHSRSGWNRLLTIIGNRLIIDLWINCLGIPGSWRRAPQQKRRPVEQCQQKHGISWQHQLFWLFTAYLEAKASSIQGGETLPSRLWIQTWTMNQVEIGDERYQLGKLACVQIFSIGSINFLKNDFLVTSSKASSVVPINDLIFVYKRHQTRHSSGDVLC